MDQRFSIENTTNPTTSINRNKIIETDDLFIDESVENIDTIIPNIRNDGTILVAVQDTSYNNYYISLLGYGGDIDYLKLSTLFYYQSQLEQTLTLDINDKNTSNHIFIDGNWDISNQHISTGYIYTPGKLHSLENHGLIDTSNNTLCVITDLALSNLTNQSILNWFSSYQWGGNDIDSENLPSPYKTQGLLFSDISGDGIYYPMYDLPSNTLITDSTTDTTNRLSQHLEIVSLFDLSENLQPTLSLVGQTIQKDHSILLYGILSRYTSPTDTTLIYTWWIIRTKKCALQDITPILDFEFSLDGLYNHTVTNQKINNVYQLQDQNIVVIASTHTVSEDIPMETTVYLISQEGDLSGSNPVTIQDNIFGVTSFLTHNDREILLLWSETQCYGYDYINLSYYSIYQTTLTQTITNIRLLSFNNEKLTSTTRNNLETTVKHDQPSILPNRLLITLGKLVNVEPIYTIVDYQLFELDYNFRRLTNTIPYYYQYSLDDVSVDDLGVNHVSTHKLSISGILVSENIELNVRDATPSLNEIINTVVVQDGNSNITYTHSYYGSKTPLTILLLSNDGNFTSQSYFLEDTLLNISTTPSSTNYPVYPRDITYPHLTRKEYPYYYQKDPSFRSDSTQLFNDNAYMDMPYPHPIMSILYNKITLPEYLHYNYKKISRILVIHV